MFLFVASVVLALSLSALCSLLESCLLSTSPGQIAELENKHPRRGAIWQQFKKDIHKPIAAILIINTAAHTIGATIAGAEFERVFIKSGQFGGQALVWFSIIFTLLMLQFTEILPKTAGVTYNKLLAPLIAFPLRWVVVALTPITATLNFLNKPFHGKHGEDPLQSVKEIAALAGQARTEEQISDHEEQIIQRALKLSDVRAGDVMIPMSQVACLSTDQTLQEAILTAHFDPHTRFPVCKNGDPDAILGYINFKELVFHARLNPNDPTLMGIIRPVFFAKPEVSLDDLLRRFTGEHNHIAIVRDGDTSLGIITLEDIVEELVGELEDEFDRLPKMLHELRGGTWMVGGGVAVNTLGERLGVDLGESDENLSTYLARKVGDKLRPNQIIPVEGASFLIRRVRRNELFEAAVTLGDGESPYANLQTLKQE
jgi:CBS domain containing-hemolysin-like protein